MDKIAKPGLMTTHEAEDYLGIGRGTLPVWRSTGRYKIPYLKLGRRKVAYLQSDLDTWLESCRVPCDEAQKTGTKVITGEWAGHRFQIPPESPWNKT